ncbi:MULTISPECIES: alpha/beta hydrolase [unclassified Beijerinckia]|uniref:alpha/beta fold hydrolase n=1 Tax=unclassified Beijerinckia TaxID=2638183 RepID=UPI000895AB86|nr:MULTISPECIES: alpha/beta hydrolase [unclassified Beijerinckia]MDH7796915.1 pimeloyl-ACP methyl ester carboxylesterase [Beijerinckia sp. GAS462]SEC65017.1 Pimeloyl-ACP methyl ester carboxylesterase [Beijerinckia sp. 28-YEA-48]
MQRSVITLGTVEVEIHEEGSGKPILFLHGASGFNPGEPHVPLIAGSRRLLCPSHPGFGRSALPDWIDNVDDVAHLYLDLMDRLGFATVDIIGCSMGGWIAAEMLTKAPERFGKAVLVGPVGIKIGPEDKLDIPDIYVMPPTDLPKLIYHDPSKFPFDPTKLSDEELTIIVRNKESTALYVWEPYMHNPKLPHRLYRVACPTLFVRGSSDGLVSADYVQGYAKLIKGSKIVTLPDAGHVPHVEQPAAFAKTVLEFLS